MKNIIAAISLQHHEARADWRTLLLAGAVLDRCLDDLEGADQVHQLQDRPAIAKASFTTKTKEGPLVARCVRAFSAAGLELSAARADLAGLEAVHGIMRPGRKFGMGARMQAAELYAECLDAIDTVVAIWCRKHGERTPMPAAPELPEPPPDAVIVQLHRRLDEIRDHLSDEDIDDGLASLEPLEELRDLAAALVPTVCGPRRVGLMVAHKLLSAVASRRPTATQQAMIERVLDALVAEETPIVRSLPNDILTIADLGAVLGHGDRKTTLRWLAQRGIPTQQPGKIIRVLVGDLEKKAWGEWSAARKAYERGPLRAFEGSDAP